MHVISSERSRVYLLKLAFGAPALAANYSIVILVTLYCVTHSIGLFFLVTDDDDDDALITLTCMRVICMLQNSIPSEQQVKEWCVRVYVCVEKICYRAAISICCSLIFNQPRLVLYGHHQRTTTISFPTIPRG